MPVITAAEASALSAANGTAIADELDAIYTAITARATAGFYNLGYSLSFETTKAAVIAQLGGTDGYTVTVASDGTLLIVWPEELV